MGRTAPEIAPSRVGSRPRLIHDSLGSCESTPPPNSISIGPVVFAWSPERDQQTHRPTDGRQRYDNNQVNSIDY